MTETSADDFAAIAGRVYDSLPMPFRQLSANVIIQIADFPDDDTLAALKINSPYGLLGLYHGVDLLQKTGFDTLPHQDRVFLYRQPILRFWQEGHDSLERVIQHVLVHEIGHHFGLSDDDMNAIEDESRGEGH